MELQPARRSKIEKGNLSTNGTSCSPWVPRKLTKCHPKSSQNPFQIHPKSSNFAQNALLGDPDDPPDDQSAPPNRFFCCGVMPQSSPKLVPDPPRGQSRSKTFLNYSKSEAKSGQNRQEKGNTFRKRFPKGVFHRKYENFYFFCLPGPLKYIVKTVVFSVFFMCCVCLCRLDFLSIVGRILMPKSFQNPSKI